MIKRILCALGIHTWGKWQDATATRKYFGEMDERTYEAQCRWCLECGKRQNKIL